MQLSGKLPASGAHEAVAALTGNAVLWGHAWLDDYPLVFFIQSPRILLWQRWWASVWLTYLIFGVLVIGGYATYRWIMTRQLSFYNNMVEAEKRLRASEADLQRSRENLVLAQKIARVGSFEHDIVTGKLEWSDEMYEILGVEKTATVPGLELLLKVVHPDDRSRLSDYRASEIDGKATSNDGTSIEYRVVRPDGAERIVRRERYVIYDEAGHPIRRYGTLQDITEQKTSEIALRRRSEALARAQRLAMIGSIEYDIVAGKYECSDETYRIFGIEKNGTALDFEIFLRYIHPEDRELVTRHRSREIAGQPAAPLEFRIVRPDGGERIIRRETDIVHDETERPIRRCGTLQDITELRIAERHQLELERQLSHSQKLEALGTLAGGIAHDLNNALVPILALSKVTARQLAAGSEARENLETIFGASEHARDLVKRVLAFSRRDVPEMHETRLGEIVIEALKLLRASIPSSIQLEERIVDLPSIRADRSGIRQVVTNLVTNAAAAIGDRLGKITVTLTMAKGVVPKRELCLSIADSGNGMDEATRARIFEPFFTTKQVGEGTGLGLSIVHGIVAAHAGRIEVESEPGKGTCFKIYFPAGEAATEAVA
jgi:PAS domain S-box-containing protein